MSDSSRSHVSSSASRTILHRHVAGLRQCRRPARREGSTDRSRGGERSDGCALVDRLADPGDDHDLSPALSEDPRTARPGVRDRCGIGTGWAPRTTLRSPWRVPPRSPRIVAGASDARGRRAAARITGIADRLGREASARAPAVPFDAGTRHDAAIGAQRSRPRAASRRRRSRRVREHPQAPCCQAAAIIWRWAPRLSISSSMTSPTFSHGGGFMPAATPGGVPVGMMSPGSSVMNCEM